MNPMRTANPTIIGLGLLVLSAPAVLAEGPPTILWQRDDHSASVRGIDFTEDGTRIISGAGPTDSSFRLWSAADGSPAGVFSLAPHGIHSVAAVPGSDLIAVGYVVSGYPPGGVAGVWDPELGTELFTAGGCFVDVSSDGAILASGGGGVNRHLDLTRIVDGVELHSIYTGSYILDVAYSPDGSRVATAGSDNAARLWDPVTGQPDGVIAAHDDDVSAVAFSPDGMYLATGAGGHDPADDSSIKIWRVEDGELLRTLEGHGDWVYALAFSPDGGTLLSSGRTGSQGVLKFWDLADGGLIQSYDASALDLGYSPDGTSFAYGSAFGDVVHAVNPVTPSAADALAADRPVFRAAPNPLRAGTRLSFRLSEAAGVRLSVHDASGRRVATLLDGAHAAGAHVILWDARNASGARVAPGVYFASLSDGVQLMTRKLVVLR
jgi:WD40 repeat protein